MTLLQQIFWGSLFLVICLIIQVSFLALAEMTMDRVSAWLRRQSRVRHVIAAFVLALAFIVTSHTAQVWTWAVVYVRFDVLPGWNPAIYFSLVTYTSLGYGDIVLAPGVRIFAGFAAITGMLGFGISTAYLVSLMNRLPTRKHWE
jgi:Ion channel